MEEEWIVEMEERVQKRRNVPTPEISRMSAGKGFCRAPAYVRRGQDPCLYIPRKVSIGPYHHGCASFGQGEREKEQCLIDFLYIFNVSLHDCMDYVVDMVDELRDMYDDLDAWWLGEINTKAFSRMMVLDACYLLEIMFESQESLAKRTCLGSNFDPTQMETYRHDMLLFDNQIPFKLLSGIYEKTWASQYVALESLLLSFFSLWLYEGPGPEMLQAPPMFMPWHVSNTPNEPPPNPPSTPTYFSLLDAYRVFLLRDEKYCSFQYPNPSGLTDFRIIPSATQLLEAEIAITTNQFDTPTNISFDHGILRLPTIVVDGATCSNFHNLVLCERLQQGLFKHFSSNIGFIGSLLQDAEDSRLLRSRGILNTTLSNEQVTELFKGLSKNITFNGYKLMEISISDLGKQLRERYDKNLEPWRKDLLQKYLRSPWAIISVFVGFLILTLTTLQTAYTVLGYYKGK